MTVNQGMNQVGSAVNNVYEDRPVIKSRVEVIESILPFVDSPPPMHSGLE